MPRISTLEIIESHDELGKLRLAQSRLKYEKRVIALQRIKTDKPESRQNLANYLMVKKRTLEGWLTEYRRNGIGGLLEVKARRKGSRFITEEIHDALNEILTDPKKGFSSYVEACNWVNEKYQVGIKYNCLRDYLKKHFGTKIKSPRKSHIKKDPKEVDLFLKNSPKN